ncbi:hypothetical protein [Novosphingobium sp.]|uniref:hypothetical protein n=1 Tax=Novosphingobium sp. TaxID=1874826 RepID=UPI00261CB455|nr:hypothetical protein [Novosphingobium sp.]
MTRAQSSFLGLKLCVVFACAIAAAASWQNVDHWLAIAEARAIEAASARPALAPLPANPAKPARPDRAAALRTLSWNALDARALADLMTSARASGDAAAASRAQAVLGKVTRRSPAYLQAELADAAKAESLERVVVALDRLLTLAPTEQPRIIPLLLVALGEPAGATMIAARHTRPWYDAMIASGARDPASLPQVAAFLLDHRPEQTDQRDQLLAAVVKGYLAQNDVAGAQAFVGSFSSTPGIDWSRLDWDNPALPTLNLPLFWRFPSPQAQLAGPKTGEMQLVVTDLLEPQPLAEKVFQVEPGPVYQIDAAIHAPDAAYTALYWKIRCGRMQIKQLSSLEKPGAKGDLSLRIIFQSRQDCSGYALTLNGDESSGIAHGQSLRISNPKLTRLE